MTTGCFMYFNQLKLGNCCFCGVMIMIWNVSSPHFVILWQHPDQPPPLLIREMKLQDCLDNFSNDFLEAVLNTNILWKISLIHSTNKIRNGQLKLKTWWPIKMFMNHWIKHTNHASIDEIFNLSHAIYFENCWNCLIMIISGLEIRRCKITLDIQPSLEHWPTWLSHHQSTMTIF